MPPTNTRASHPTKWEVTLSNIPDTKTSSLRLAIDDRAAYAASIKQIFQWVTSENHAGHFTIPYFETRRVVGASTRCTTGDPENSMLDFIYPLECSKPSLVCSNSCAK